MSDVDVLEFITTTTAILSLEENLMSKLDLHISINIPQPNLYNVADKPVREGIVCMAALPRQLPTVGLRVVHIYEFQLRLFKLMKFILSGTPKVATIERPHSR